MSEEFKKEDFSISIFGLLNDYNEDPNIHLQEEMNKIIKRIKAEARRELLETELKFIKGIEGIYPDHRMIINKFKEYIERKLEELNH